MAIEVKWRDVSKDGAFQAWQATVPGQVPHEVCAYLLTRIEVAYSLTLHTANTIGGLQTMLVAQYPNDLTPSEARNVAEVTIRMFHEDYIAGARGAR